LPGWLRQQGGIVNVRIVLALSLITCLVLLSACGNGAPTARQAAVGLAEGLLTHNAALESASRPGDPQPDSAFDPLREALHVPADARAVTVQVVRELHAGGEARVDIVFRRAGSDLTSVTALMCHEADSVWTAWVPRIATSEEQRTINHAVVAYLSAAASDDASAYAHISEPSDLVQGADGDVASARVDAFAIPASQRFTTVRVQSVGDPEVFIDDEWWFATAQVSIVASGQPAAVTVALAGQLSPDRARASVGYGQAQPRPAHGGP
jgi:hypothetical protein